MTLRLRVSVGAEIDIAERYAYIGLDSRDAAERFLDQVDKTFSALATAPRMGRPFRTARRGLRGIRVQRVIGFPDILIFYRVGPTTIEIRRILHGAMDLDRELGH